LKVPWEVSGWGWEPYTVPTPGRAAAAVMERDLVYGRYQAVPTALPFQLCNSTYLLTRRSARSRSCIVSRVELVGERRTLGFGRTSWTGDERALVLEL